MPDSLSLQTTDRSRNDSLAQANILHSPSYILAFIPASPLPDQSHAWGLEDDRIGLEAGGFFLSR